MGARSSMATSSIGTTTVVKKEYGKVLLQAIHRHKALAQARDGHMRHGGISEARAVGTRR